MDSSLAPVTFGFVLITVPNLIVIVGMVFLFAIALVAPFPHDEGGGDVRGK